MSEDLFTCRRCGVAQPLDRFQRLPRGRRRVCNRCRAIPTPYGTHRIQAVTAPTRTESPTLVDLAWAAGVWEGEGSVIFAGTFRIEVAQKDRWILDRLRERFGGSIYVRKEHYLGGRYILHKWYLTGARGRGFAYSIFSWLSPRRREQVRRALGVAAVETAA
jgi:hypothetical protein